MTNCHEIGREGGLGTKEGWITSGVITKNIASRKRSMRLSSERGAAELGGEEEAALDDHAVRLSPRGGPKLCMPYESYPREIFACDAQKSRRRSRCRTWRRRGRICTTIDPMQ
jgi:hypothetical protein